MGCEELHKSTPTTFRVDFLESFFLLSLQPVISPFRFGIADSDTHLVDDAESGHEKA
jgi:hypothetical protein